MDDLGQCLLEFFVRSRLPDTRIVSMSDPDSRFKKTFLLKILQNHLSSDRINITENFLRILEHLEELFRSDGFPITATMSAAYCAVAVECTIKYLRLNLYSHNPLYLRAVNRIWRNRIPYMNSSGSREESLLFSVELEGWRRDIETSLLDSQARERLAAVKTRRDAIIKLRACLEEALTVLGTPLVPLTATEHTNKTQRNQEGGHTEHTNKAQLNEEGEVQKCNSAAAENLYLPTTVEVEKIGDCMSGVEKIGDCISEELLAQDSLPKIVEVEKVRDCISGDLQALAKDFLTTTMEDNEEVQKTIEADLSCPQDINDNKTDPVENAARVDERDSVDNLQGGTSRFNLQSPKRRKHSPLKIYKPTVVTKRRKIKRWTQLEEETLKNGVETFGMGNWKLILNAHKDIFEERTEVDLKDKWRNMSRHGCK
ncbi:uncharacterized protein LOC106761076 isoform X2 [Vigna radiata var. radiata]|uniref:Uncharacterized protein LOC106761076 isoform X2 n=1 Tax=Vigna radiata var. radiata TaxID=3916 RepID=A0A1S3U218_VIGRR|nr:uncharacterized protein LOC106761076 isoform X2 [Vigna radiata var. radiata]